MKLKKNNKGFALAEILAVTLVLMVIFTVLYSNFMPLAGEYEKNISYKDVSSQYTLHYFKKMLLTKVDKSALTLDNKKFKVLDSSICNSDTSCTSLFNTFNPYLILTKYNISELKSDIANTNDETLKEFSSYIKSSPDYKNRDNQEEVYRLMIKTDSGYATSALFDVNVSNSGSDMTALEFANANVKKGGLEQVSHSIDGSLQVDSNFTNEYRYRGGNVNNYVTFNNEVWRIIGIIPTSDTNGNVENRFKIIRDESIGNMKWNTTQDTTTNSYNNWVTGTLNTYLNNDYYNALSTDAKNMIGTTKYYLGGYSSSDITSDVMWQYERKNDANRTGYSYGTNPVVQSDASKKIAIMYVSDYRYGASTSCTNTLKYYAGTNYNSSTECNKTNNWLDISQSEWSISQHVLFGGSNVFDLSPDGYVVNYGDSIEYLQYAIRPVLSLLSNVKIVGGDGTSESPYQLGV